MSNNERNKAIQRARMITCFVNAAEEIMERDGMRAVTARKVADEAGYNVATLYNYFESLNHLILFTSIKYLGEYGDDLSIRLQTGTSTMDQFNISWDCFCLHSFRHPSKFHSIFFGEFSEETVNASIKLYFDIFPEALTKNNADFIPILRESDMYSRNMILLKLLSKENVSLPETDLQEMNDMMVLIYQSMLFRFMNQSSEYTEEEAISLLLRYFRKIIDSYGLLKPKYSDNL